MLKSTDQPGLTSTDSPGLKSTDQPGRTSSRHPRLDPADPLSAIRFFLLGESLSFGIAASVHRGLLVAGYADPAAAVAETVIASVLLAGLGLSALLPDRTRLIGSVAQAFALLGTLVGVFTIAIGVGPRSVPDIAYHVCILLVLGWGLFVASRPDAPTPSPTGRG